MAACRLCRRQEPTLAEILLLLPFPTRIGVSTAGRTGPPAEVVGSRDDMRNSGRFPAEIRHRVVQHAEDHGAVFAREALLQRRKPGAHRFERWTDRLGGNDALDADRGGRLLAREQDFLQALAGPDARGGGVACASWVEGRGARA